MSGEADREAPAGEGFLGRWSRRKRAAREAPPAEAEPLARPATPPAPMPVAGEVPDEAPAAAAEAEVEPIELPPIESLSAESDFAVFLRPGVPAPLRAAALRRLWTLDPAIRDFTNSLDYGWDFNAPDGGMAGFANAFAGDVEPLLRQALGLVERAAAEPEPEPAPAAPAEAAVEAPRPASAFVPPDAAPALAEPAPLAPEPPAPRRRHGGAVPA